MKFLNKIVELRQRLDAINKQINFISSELDVVAGDLVDYLENKNLIAKTHVVAQKLENKFKNYYYCPECGVGWQDIWTSTSNDRCPTCNKEIEPYDSEDI